MKNDFKREGKKSASQKQVHRIMNVSHGTIQASIQPQPEDSAYNYCFTRKHLEDAKNPGVLEAEIFRSPARHGKIRFSFERDFEHTKIRTTFSFVKSHEYHKGTLEQASDIAQIGNTAFQVALTTNFPQVPAR